MHRRSFLAAAAGSLAFLSLAGSAVAGRPAYAEWDSETVKRKFGEFAETGKMPGDLGAWLRDPSVQEIEPFQCFDNVWYVGLRWVESYVIRTSAGYVLIDTTENPGHVLRNLKKIGVPYGDVKYVLMTHGHFDHVGGAVEVKKALPNARFAMGERGWEEAISKKGPDKNAHDARMIPRDIVLKDGETVTLGDTKFLALSTPGHTWGTFSYVYPVFWNGKRHVGVTIGGLGLNAIEGPSQVEAFIHSMERLADPALGIEADLTAHPFTTGLIEKIPEIRRMRKDGLNLLVNRKEFLEHLEELKANARARLRKMRG
ncbi:MAG: MBL fold metallo-hydrolase [Sutterellaceae bacterium]|nr:MBL fold metallo-hydrolase [Sutterellaceae bacterium]MDD7442522.1 MBL fold metallo-hydrolase [Sutterellaceae bacterium]MDY2869211.1 MBL fold metallo-hydrolase [Mesosutterella sp.]